MTIKTKEKIIKFVTKLIGYKEEDKDTKNKVRFIKFKEKTIYSMFVTGEELVETTKHIQLYMHKYDKDKPVPDKLSIKDIYDHINIRNSLGVDLYAYEESTPELVKKRREEQVIKYLMLEKLMDHIVKGDLAGTNVYKYQQKEGELLKQKGYLIEVEVNNKIEP